jgi:hypothetical protein
VGKPQSSAEASSSTSQVNPPRYTGLKREVFDASA